MSDLDLTQPQAGDPDAPTPPLPSYAPMFLAYQRAHAAELRKMIADLPLRPGDRVLDLACGAGAYTCWLAERVGPGGLVSGLDISAAYLALARERAAASSSANVDFHLGTSDALPFEDDSFDLVWSAQSMYSLPDLARALRELQRVTRPGGVVAIFENDSLHQLVLPWPAELELAVRTAQLRALKEINPSYSRSGKVGMRAVPSFPVEPALFSSTSEQRDG